MKQTTTFTKVSENFDCKSEQAWNGINEVKIEFFLDASSENRPEVTCKTAYSTKGIYLHYSVKGEKFIQAQMQHYQDSVCFDSCVEFFIRPPQTKEYLNFEVSGGGAMLLYHVINPFRTDDGLEKFNQVSEEIGNRVERISTLPAAPFDLGEEARDWTMTLFIPFSIFKDEFGIDAPVSGDKWTANFYKCADHSKKPHWCAWSPVSKFNFHLPDEFGTIIFG